MAADNNTAVILPDTRAYISAGSRAFADAVIIYALWVYFAAYPFIFRNLATPIYSMALNASLVLVGFTLLFRPRIPSPAPLFRPVSFRIAGLFYIAYFIVLISVSLSNSGSPVVGKAAMIRIRDAMFVMILIIFLSEKGIYKMIRLYLNVLAFFAVLGLVLEALIFLGLVHPLTEVSLDNLPGLSENHRLFYGIGFVWPDTWVGSLVGLERLQSFADEAGTFAFALTPAILFAFKWGMKWRAAVMSAALIFTFSIGAIALWVVIVTVYFLSRRERKAIYIWAFAILLICLAVSLTAVFLYMPDIWKMGENYFMAKFGDDNNVTSVGQRWSDLKIVILKVLDHPLGFGSGSLGVAFGKGVSLAIGWFIPLAEAGLVGWLLYLLAFGFVLQRAVRDVFWSRGIVGIAALIIVINGYAALQRAGIDSNIWQWFWLTTYLRLSAAEAQVRSAGIPA